MVKSNFIAEIIGNQTYWLPNSFSIPKTYKDFVYLLPAFDEFIINYKDRSASLPFEHHIKAVSNNGMFFPTIVENGQVYWYLEKNHKKRSGNAGNNLF